MHDKHQYVINFSANPNKILDTFIRKAISNYASIFLATKRQIKGI